MDFKHPYVFAADRNIDDWKDHFERKKIPYFTQKNHGTLDVELVINYKPMEKTPTKTGREKRAKKA